MSADSSDNAAAAAGKSLKQRNLSQLRYMLLANVVVCVAVFNGIGLTLEGLKVTIASVTESVALFSVAGLFTIALCQAVPETWKHVFVFWRFKHVLPGHRAFTVYGPKVPRVDLQVLKTSNGELPTDPEGQNRVWYGMLKRMEKAHPYISENHRTFLLMRDASILAGILFVIVSLGTLVLGIQGPARIWLPGLLLVEMLILNLAANNTGVELVRNVLAAECSKD